MRKPGLTRDFGTSRDCLQLYQVAFNFILLAFARCCGRKRDLGQFAFFYQNPGIWTNFWRKTGLTRDFSKSRDCLQLYQVAINRILLLFARFCGRKRDLAKFDFLAKSLNLDEFFAKTGIDKGFL